MPFPAIRRPLLPLLIFLASSWYEKAKIGLRIGLEKMINYHVKRLCKTTYNKTKSKFLSFFFSHWLLHKCLFSFLIKVFVNFEKLIRFHWEAVTVYKNWENLKMLIEIFCQKLIVSNVILVFLDHLKPKTFSVDQPWWARAAPIFEISGSAPDKNSYLLHSFKCFEY